VTGSASHGLSGACVILTLFWANVSIPAGKGMPVVVKIKSGKYGIAIGLFL
jgi:hypothetical protein